MVLTNHLTHRVFCRRLRARRPVARGAFAPTGRETFSVGRIISPLLNQSHMRKEFLAFAPPSLGEEEILAVTNVLKTDWLSSGPKTAEFESLFAQAVGAEGALALNSCTAALHVALLAHNIGPGDEVITTAMTFCATANVIEHVGATTVLADVNPDTLLIDPLQIEKRITKRTKAIIPVHYAGHPCDMDRINAMAAKHNLVVIEDAAHCMPSKIGDLSVGATKNLTCFSFYANKNMTTGEGGMLTGPKELLEKARVLALHGMSRNAWKRFEKGGSWRYDVPAPGFKYNMSDILASIGIVQLGKLDGFYRRRCEIAARYDKAFKESMTLKPLTVLEGFQTSYHLYVVQLNLEKLSIDRDQFIVELAERNIGCSVHYVPIHMHSYYQNKYGFKPVDFPHAFGAFQRILSLPLSPRHRDQDIDDVIAAVNEVGEKFKR